MIKHICEEEVLRYLGYPSRKAADSATLSLIEECKQELVSSVRPKTVYRRLGITFSEDAVCVNHSDIHFLGKSIYRHLSGANECIVMAATLGNEAERIIQKAQIFSAAKGLVMDACATAFVEAVCDCLEKEINQKEGICNFRFSPGYGDFPITQQKEILSLLDAEKRIGLYTNDAHLLIPRKSVTAVLALGKNEKMTENKCDQCANKEGCAFRNYES
ncbi:MAG: methionine synthase [Clostridia bacterium]|nr:methionine synthase [Clostridia bacterium]